MTPRPLILVVDDNPITLRVARAVLQGEGWSVRTALDAAGAEAAFDAERPDAVLVDLALPDIDGATLARRLRARGAGVPLFAYSALIGTLGEEQDGERLFDAQLPKPISPRALVEALRCHLPEPEPAESPAKGRYVLVVDDDPLNRKLLAAHLGAVGFEVDVAEDATQAWRMLGLRTPDVVVSDVLMPTVDGFELCMAIRRSAAHRHLPVFLMTSHYDEDADAEMARKAGATRFLVRGESLDALTDGALACLAAQRPAPPVAPDAERERVRRARRQLERQFARCAALVRENDLLSARLATLSAVAQAGGRPCGDGPVGEILQNLCAAAGAPGGVLWLASAGPDLRLACANALDPAEVPAQAIDAAWTEGRATSGSSAVAPVESRGERIGVLALRSRPDVEDTAGLALAVAAQLGHSISLTRAFQRTARAEVRWAALMENANDAIAVLDAEGRYVEANHRWEELTGTTRAQIIGRRLVDMLPPEVPLERRSEVQLVFAAGEYARQGATWYRLDGTPQTVDFTVSTMTIGGETLTITIARDVTERARLESELRHAQKMEAIGRLATGVAHDFNNLLTVILADADLLAYMIHGGTAHQLATEIRKKAEQAGALTRHLLTFGRRDSTRLHAMDLNTLLSGCAPVMRRLVCTTVEIRVELADVPAVVLGDESEIEQVLLNLVANARDAMPLGGVLTLAIVCDGERVVLQATDTGSGMNDETMAHIFEPFYTTKAPSRGTGLGLATVQTVARRLGGGVEVKSEPGVGTCFRVWLPAATPIIATD